MRPPSLAGADLGDPGGRSESLPQPPTSALRPLLGKRLEDTWVFSGPGRPCKWLALRRPVPDPPSPGRDRGVGAPTGTCCGHRRKAVRGRRVPGGGEPVTAAGELPGATSVRRARGASFQLRARGRGPQRGGVIAPPGPGQPPHPSSPCSGFPGSRAPASSPGSVRVREPGAPHPRRAGRCPSLAGVASRAARGGGAGPELACLPPDGAPRCRPRAAAPFSAVRVVPACWTKPPPRSRARFVGASSVPRVATVSRSARRPRPRALSGRCPGSAPATLGFPGCVLARAPGSLTEPRVLPPRLLG